MKSKERKLSKKEAIEYWKDITGIFIIIQDAYYMLWEKLEVYIEHPERKKEFNLHNLCVGIAGNKKVRHVLDLAMEYMKEEVLKEEKKKQNI